MAQTPNSSQKQALAPAFFMPFLLHKPLLVPCLSASFITIFSLDGLCESRRKLLISLKKFQI